MRVHHCWKVRDEPLLLHTVLIYVLCRVLIHRITWSLVTEEFSTMSVGEKVVWRRQAPWVPPDSLQYRSLLYTASLSLFLSLLHTPVSCRLLLRPYHHHQAAKQLVLLLLVPRQLRDHRSCEGKRRVDARGGGGADSLSTKPPVTWRQEQIWKSKTFSFKR